MSKWTRLISKVDVYGLMNRIAGGCRGNIITVKFSVENRDFEAYVPDDELWGAVKSILLSREYEYLPEFELNNFKDKLIVDAGAHVGLFSLVSSYYARKVIAIEAHPVTYKLLEINMIKNNIKNVVTLNRALVSKNVSKVRIYNASHTGGASVVPWTSKNRFYEVATITIGEIIHSHGYIDLLKMDVEGAEFDIFKNVNNEILKNIGAIVGEIHLKHGELNSITQTLEKVGFRVYYFHLPIVKKSGRTTIKLHNCLRLRILGKCIYTLAPLGHIRDKNHLILFAKKK